MYVYVIQTPECYSLYLIAYIYIYIYIYKLLSFYSCTMRHYPQYVRPLLIIWAANKKNDKQLGSCSERKSCDHRCPRARCGMQQLYDLTPELTRNLKWSPSHPDNDVHNLSFLLARIDHRCPRAHCPQARRCPHTRESCDHRCPRTRGGVQLFYVPYTRTNEKPPYICVRVWLTERILPTWLNKM